VPVVCSYHTRFTSYLPYYFKGVTLDAIDSTIWWWLRKFHQRCDHIYPPTQGVVDELVHQGFPKEAMRLWPRGVNLTKYSPKYRSEPMRRSWNITDDSTVAMLMVTRVVWEKNLKKFISACTALLEGGAPVRCVLVGDGPALPRVRELLPSAVFMGSLHKSELSTAYASADIFFFPSITETWGSVTLEAMASGLAVVVASGPGGSELVEDGVTGLRVNTSHFGATVTSLSKLVHDNGLRRRLALAGRARVLNATDWSWDHAMGMLKQHYAEILEERRGGSVHGNMSVHGGDGLGKEGVWPATGFQ
jgi:phosphatidylinositol alpha 1,6-mannosyltransferase